MPKLAPRLTNPQTKLGIAVRRTVLRLAAAPGIWQVVGKLATPSANEV